LPGSHKRLLQKPDLYGPLLAVFTLPQVLLFAMDVSRHHCRRDMLLGNSVMVSLGLWLGLSILYKLIGYLAGSQVRLRDILCMCGYSFYGWSASILTSFAFEASTSVMGLSPMLPLLLCGIPSAVSMGSMFWDQTPVLTQARARNHTPQVLNIQSQVQPQQQQQPQQQPQLQRFSQEGRSVRRRQSRDDTLSEVEAQPLLDNPDQTDSASPVQSPSRPRSYVCACGHVCHCATTIQRFLRHLFSQLFWLVPKAIGFVVVCGTHYQFLWYLARVFLPGKKQLCKLTSLLQPQDYANIITQKDLRSYLSTVLANKR
jgi:hypothetical protein